MNIADKEAALTISNVAVHFGGLVAISDLNFSVKEGEILSLIGPNGAGKTTAFNVITGFLKPTSGSVNYRKQSLNGLKPSDIAEKGVIRTFQKTSVFDNITVLENTLIGLHRRGRSRSWEIILGLPRVADEERRLLEIARETLDFVGLGHRHNDIASDLPYGELRLLEVAVAIAADPSMLMLDEPASGMNPNETTNFMDIVGKIRERGITILLIEHNMKMVMEISLSLTAICPMQGKCTFCCKSGSLIGGSTVDCGHEQEIDPQDYAEGRQGVVEHGKAVVGGCRTGRI